MGLALVVASGLAFWFLAIKSVDLVILAISGITIGVAALALVTTSLTAIVIARTLRGSPGLGGLRLECGYDQKTGFSVSTLWFVPLVFLRFRWFAPAGEVSLVRQHWRSFETVTPHRRGCDDEIRREIEVSDAFRLTKITLHHVEKRQVRCLPSVGALRRMNVVQSITR